MQKWAETSYCRLFEIDQLESRTCAAILDKFPTIRKPEGYQLVKIDFDTKYPNKSNLLYECWANLKGVLKTIATTDVHDQAGRITLSLLGTQGLSEGNYDAIS